MLDYLAGVEVTDEPQPLKLANPDHAPIKPHPSRQATHWTRRLPDIVGGALQKLVQPSLSEEGVESRTAARNQSVQSDVPGAGDTSMLLHALQSSNQRPVADSPPELDRRGFPRRPSECSVIVIERRETGLLTPHEIDLWLQVGGSVGKLLDISQTGLCLQLNREIAPHTEILLRISNHHLNQKVDTVATVIHSRAIGHERFSIHCRVASSFTRSQLQDLGRPPVNAGHLLA